MAEPSQAEMVGNLKSGWRQWTEILHVVASRQEKRYAIDPEEYRAVYAELLRVSQVLAAQVDDASRPAFRELEEILAPWVSFDSLMWAEHEIVCKLLDRCQAVQRLLDGRPAPRAKWRLGGFGWLIVALAAGVIAGLAWAAGLVTLPSLRASPWIQQMAHFVKGDGSGWYLLVGGAAVVAMAVLLVWRSVRRA